MPGGRTDPQMVRVRFMDRLLMVDSNTQNVPNPLDISNGYDSILANLMFLCIQRIYGIIDPESVKFCIFEIPVNRELKPHGPGSLTIVFLLLLGRFCVTSLLILHYFLQNSAFQVSNRLLTVMYWKTFSVLFENYPKIRISEQALKFS